MIIDWNAFTPISALAGGILIGLGTAVLLLWSGRIAGISGILGGLLARKANETGWRLAFVLGLLLAAPLWKLFAGLPPIRVDANYSLLIIAGLLVGAGTRYAAGCTSGHGVCGLARLSPRSLVATLVFMGAGFSTVYLTRHWLGG